MMSDDRYIYNENISAILFWSDLALLKFSEILFWI